MFEVDFLSPLASAVNQYFVDPLAHPNDFAPYNAVNTLTFAALALLAAYLIYRLLPRLGVKINAGFFWAVVPFITLGSAVRVLVDAQVLPRSVVVLGYTAYPFVTPVVYVLVFLVVIACLAASKASSNGSEEEFHKRLKWSGAALFVLALLPLAPKFSNYASLAYILGLSALGAAAYPVVWRARGLELDRVEWFTAWAQCLDGAATFVGVSFYGYSEQHVLGNAVFSFFGTPFAFFLIKVAFGLLVAWLASRELSSEKDRPVRAYVLLLVCIFGLAPGGRDALRLLCGV